MSREGLAVQEGFTFSGNLSNSYGFNSSACQVVVFVFLCCLLFSWRQGGENWLAAPLGEVSLVAQAE